MIHLGVGHVLLALVAAAGAGAPSAYSAITPAGTPTATRPAPVAQARDTCGAEPVDAAGWNRMFRALDGDWSGGDAALSLRLPDGRLLWLFGDSFVGDVTPEGRRASGTTIVRNAALISDGTCVTAVTPGRATLPGRGGTWLWPTSMVLTRTAPDGTATVAVFAQRMASTGTGAWSFRRVGASVATVTVRPGASARVTSVRDLPRSSVLWGAAAVTHAGVTYVYGTRAVDEPLVFGRELLVARSRTPDVRDPAAWTYRTADGWSADARDAVAVVPARTGVSTNPAVVFRDGRFRIVTKPQEFLDDRVVVMSSPTPYGPWASRTLFRSPSTESTPTYAPTVVARGASSHDVVVVNRTSTSMDRLMRDAAVAVPLFRDADLGRG